MFKAKSATTLIQASNLWKLQTPEIKAEYAKRYQERYINTAHLRLSTCRYSEYEKSINEYKHTHAGFIYFQF